MTTCTTTPPADLQIDQLAGLLLSGPLVVLTGAGLSTASGIPAYRDEHGQWQQRRPIQHQAFLKDEAVRRRYWARSLVGWPLMSTARPNAGHASLARLAHAGLIPGLITQNVDGLHQRAGSPHVLELHGGLAWVGCLGCQQRYPRGEVQQWLRTANPDFSPTPLAQAPDGDVQLEDAAYVGFQVPDCPRCGGLLKPDVVFFGDNVPRERVAEAMQLVDEAAGLLVVGSSLTVYSGYRFALRAHERGKPVVALNRGVTRADPLLSLKIEADCPDSLHALVQRLSL
jgi:NAD-dependent SIR2 family protein deacetylase